MRDSITGSGIISYSGLRLDELLLCMQQELDPDGDRLCRFLPLFPAELIQNMPYVGLNGRCAAPSGFTVDPLLYHDMLLHEIPELYTGENAVRCIRDGDFIGKDMYVDAAWADHFPQYADFLGEKLYVRLIGGGYQGVAVPQSLYPLGAEWLDYVERKLGITQRAQDAARYIANRIRKGEHFEVTQYESDYLQATGVSTFWVKQSDLEHYRRNQQYVSGKVQPVIYSGDAAVPQYVPSLVACDLFTDYYDTPFTKKLAQLFYEGDDYVSDFWIPWRQAWTFGDLKRNAINALLLCQGYQMPPSAMADGAKYPATLRVVSIQAGHLPMQMAEISANSCYGKPSVPTGAATKLIYIPNSKALIENGTLRCESLRLLMEQTALSEMEWLEMRKGAFLNWQYSRLNDELLARDRVLNGLDLTMPGVSEALEPYNRRIDALERELSEYNVDDSGAAKEQCHYLQRKYRFTTGACEADLPYFLDEQLEASIGELAAMRNAMPVYDWRELWKINTEPQCEEKTITYEQDGGSIEEKAPPARRKRGRPSKKRMDDETEQISFFTE